MLPDCLSSGQIAPVTWDICFCLFIFFNFLGLLKPSYLCIWAFPNCFPPNFNKGCGLISPISQPGPSADSAQCLMNVTGEGSWDQSLHSQKAAAGPGASDFASLLRTWAFFQVTCGCPAGGLMFPWQPGAVRPGYIPDSL